MTYSIKMPDGALVQNIPDDLPPSDAKLKIIDNHPKLIKNAGQPEVITANAFFGDIRGGEKRQ